ncbi:Cation/multidrug efflux pump [Rhodovulum sp. P5]|uniref:YidH family protein n=1 Tax=Rhodovulum sp. P5 TaxID=1564506 RepID=UPI0009C3618A|nr:DUF202 domain-containing protein [Rhodovulum sp. P5]ARE38614.1 Cation/multidrug efflux pump [Rhodovulum sp. P5]
MIPNYTSHAANERTFLAWVRTVIAIEGFGLVAARLRPETPLVWSEVALLVAGGVVILLAYLRMQRIRRLLDKAERSPDETGLSSAFLVLLVAALFALFGMFVLHVR